MSVSALLRRSSAFASVRTVSLRKISSALALLLLTLVAVTAHAASIRGIVTDASGARVAGAKVNLISNGKIVGAAVSASDGSFQILTGTEGRFFLMISASSFRQLETPSFYAGTMDSIERNLVLEPEYVRQSIVVTATGVPTPQAQTSETTSVLVPLDLALREDLTSALRLMPGTVVTQTGQMGAQTSLFIRGGNADDNKVLVDGVDAGDLGNRFDFGSHSTTALERAEVYRGPDSSLYGADADSGVVSLITPHGTTTFPSFLFSGDAGTFNTFRDELEVAGAHNKLDYLGAFSWLQTSNDLPMDEYHVATTAANVGWQPSASTQIRATLHYGVDGTEVPNAWDFYHVADDATQKDQDIFLSGSVDNQTTADFHNSFRYGLTRKREQYNLWTLSGSGLFDQYGDTLGDLVTIIGANNTAATGRAVLDYGLFGDQLVSNRDQFIYHGDYRVTPHLTGFFGYQYENERGMENYGTKELTRRNNSDYLMAIHGDFKNRFYYTLAGSVGHYSLFGTEASPHAGASYYLVRPRAGIFGGSRILFNYGDAIREPTQDEQNGSLYTFLQLNDPALVQQLKISPIAAPAARTYEGGFEQSFLHDRIVLRSRYFHNQFGREIEYVPVNVVQNLDPSLPSSLLNQAFGFDVNTEAYRAQGIETTVESGIGRYVFLRGGYTYLDGVVQRSFDSDNEALVGGYAPTYNGIPIGATSPLDGARPFRRPPHTGFFTASYSERRMTAVLTSAFASRSDDSTFLEYADQNDGNSLLLPNRNLDHGYAKIDLGGSYQLLDWLGIYAQAENLANNQHIAPIGYPSLPMTARIGLRIALGKGSSK